MTIDDVTNMLEGMADDALRVYHDDRKAGANAVSVAFNAGRVDAFKQALDRIQSIREKAIDMIQSKPC